MNKFNHGFLPLITDDRKLISKIITYFRELDPISRIFNTPCRKKNIEEEKSTCDTPPKNKCINLNQESPKENRDGAKINLCSSFMVTPFDRKDEDLDPIIEEENHFESLDQMLFGFLEKYSNLFSE